MHLAELYKDKKVKVGTKQSLRAINEGNAVTVFIAKDCEQHVTRSVLELAQENQTQIVYVESMKKLGEACGIDVGAATAVIIK